jgi:Flp pilus assembly protein TadD
MPPAPARPHRLSSWALAAALGLAGPGLLGLAGGCSSGLGGRYRVEKVDVRPVVTPDQPAEFYLALARAFLTQKNYTAALGHIREAKKRAPKRADVYRVSGIALREAKLYPDAEKDLLQAVKLNKKDAGAWNALGILYDLIDRSEDADKAHRKAIDLAPKEAAYSNDLGFSLYLRGKYVDSVVSFRQALRQQPTMVRARNNLGFAYGRLGHYGRAYREFLRVNNQPQALNNMGLVYEARGENDRAIESYVEAVKQLPELSVARGNVTALCQKLRRPLPALPVARAVSKPDGQGPPAREPLRIENVTEVPSQPTPVPGDAGGRT